MLADKDVELVLATRVSQETIRQTLKKRLSSRQIEYWVIPPECDAEFVASMEEVLESYEKPCNPSLPVICLDEQPVQLIKDVRMPIAETREHARRVDCECERAGVANIFMFTEPLAGWRQAFAREIKTKADDSYFAKSAYRSAIRPSVSSPWWRITR